jgi:hypothetical protein
VGSPATSDVPPMKRRSPSSVRLGATSHGLPPPPPRAGSTVPRYGRHMKKPPTVNAEARNGLPDRTMG